MQTRSMSRKSGNKIQTNCDKMYPERKDLLTGKTNPLFISEITDHMFQFLKLPDIKNCRSVCRQWNEVAEKYLKQLSVVNILRSNCLEKFNQEFPNAQQCQIFTCFRFEILFDSWMPINNFVPFFENCNNLSELTLLGCKFNSKYGLSPLLPSTLIKLHIYSFNRMIISIDKICNIRILKLKNCILNITPGTTLNNVEIDLNVTFYEFEKPILRKFLINPLLNFDVLKKASFGGVDIMLDLQGSRLLDELSVLKGTALLNWDISNWEIKKLFLDVFPCEELEDKWAKSQIKYKELNVKLKNLNVSLLPVDIEKLEVNLQYDEEVPPRIYGEHNFLDLKHLQISLDEETNFSPFVELFKHCPRLAIISVSNIFARDRGNCILKTSSVPPSVKTLRLLGVRIIVDQRLQLESLILGGQDKSIIDIAKELHVKNLMWIMDKAVITSDGYQNISNKDKANTVKRLIDLNLNNFLVSDFSEVNNSEFEKTYWFPLVDTQGQYFLFQRGKKGKSISERNWRSHVEALLT